MDKNMESKIKSFIDAALKKHDANVQKFNSTLIYKTLDEKKISVESIGARVTKVEETVERQNLKIQDLEKSLEFTQQLLDDKIKDLDQQWNNNLQQKINGLNECIYHTNREAKYFKDKLRTLEDRNRRNNIRVDGMVENENETWEDSERKVKDMIRAKLGVNEEIVVERAHRIGRKENGKKRSIVCKLQSWKQKEIIIKNSNKLKNTGIYINEDYSDETMTIRRSLFKEMMQAREAGKYAKVVYDKLFVREFRQART
ncbi:uncharacterized protein [Clytia hemisphaerica]|uniref:uncharacterized protein n=1 Tax=Clytia hemisphaerica TaxID=252671 RepID=UPI0034D73054